VNKLSTTAPDAIRSSLKRKIGLLDAVSIGLGAMIGAGIFVVIGAAAGMAGPSVFLSVLLSGLSATFSALSFAELGSAMPRAGGVYEYGHEIISHSTGFLLGWMWVLGNIVLGATASIGFGYYLSSILTFIPFKTAAIVILTIVVFLNVMGIRLSAMVNDVLVLVKIGALLLFLLIGLSQIEISNFSNPFPNGFLPVVQAAGLFYFAYIGFPRISTTAEEIKQPERNIPAAIIIALVLSVLLYFLTAITAVGLIGYEKLGASVTPIGDAAEALGLRSVLEIGALVATFSVILTSVMGQSRIFFAMARNGEVPLILSDVHPRFDTPIYSIILSGIIMVMFAMSIDITGLASLASFCILFTHIFTNYAAFKLYRSSRNNVPFKSPIRPLHSLAGLMMSCALCLSLGLGTVLLGGLVAIAGLSWYVIYTRGSRARLTHRQVDLQMSFGKR